MNLADHLSWQASAQPFGLAVIRGRRAITFRDLDQLVWSLAGWLRANGAAASNVVGLTFRDEVQHLITSLAVVRIGGVQITLPASDPTQMVNDLIKRTGLALVLTDVQDRPDWEAPMLEVKLGRLFRNGRDVTVRSGDLSSPVLLTAGSGTTGRRKILLQTAGQYLARWAAGAEASDIRPADRFLAVSPMDFASIKRRRLGCALFGGTNVFLSKIENFASACNLLRVDHLRLVARQAEVLLQSRGRRAPGLLLPYLRTLSMGSATVPEALREAIRSKLTNAFVVAYATSETGPVTAAFPHVQARYPGSVGLPAKGVEVEIVDNGGRLVPPGIVGEIRLRSPGMATGYFDDPEASAKAFRGGWFYPRDLGSLTDDGVLVFHGRADDMMIFDGINIFPREIELALEQHACVEEALAFPIPHRVHQDVPAAAVILRTDVLEQDLITFCRERLGVRSPRRILTLQDFPEEVRGKLLRREFWRLFDVKL